MTAASDSAIYYDPFDIEIDGDDAVQAHTPTVRGWEKLPAITV